MGMFRRRVPNHYIPIHPDNVAKNDWIIVLEAGTIVGPSPDKLRVAVATLERKIVKKFNILLRAKHYLVVDGYDPRIHALYFSPQKDTRLPNPSRDFLQRQKSARCTSLLNGRLQMLFENAPI